MYLIDFRKEIEKQLESLKAFKDFKTIFQILEETKNENADDAHCIISL